MEIPTKIQNNIWMLDLWDRLYACLETTGYLHELDFMAIQKFVETSYEIEKIEKRIAQETNGSSFIWDEKNNCSKEHPLNRTLNEKLRILNQQMDALGLNPKSRRFLLKKQEEDKDDTSEFEFLND